MATTAVSDIDAMKAGRPKANGTGIFVRRGARLDSTGSC
eukprot:CAMPEP_0119406646 /NCGR_PEP_ID=MMETSP1335-20130426/891_1 /TAXON_ID=259385 /ORGANISM="Chrysoculter rhomboideus, Strain RCC1486" /LENGTH=38 /DNA_ID= /DNA_START= /DNA_END= /DNA_ORIENTATION=